MCVCYSGARLDWHCLGCNQVEFIAWLHVVSLLKPPRRTPLLFCEAKPGPFAKPGRLQRLFPETNAVIKAPLEA